MKSSAILALFVTGFLSSGVSRADPIQYTFTSFISPFGGPTTPRDINDAGDVVGYSGGVPFSYANGAFTQLPANRGASMATGINNTGQIVGFGQFGAGDILVGDGFLIDHGAVTYIDFPGATQQTAFNGINNLGQIVGTALGSNGINSGFIYSNGVFTPINVPGAFQVEANGINDKGQVVGVYNDTNAFLDTGGVITPIAVPGASFTFPYGINDQGQIVGLFVDSPGAPSHGFVDTDGVFTTIDFAGAGSTTVYGINNEGQIVGSAPGVNPAIPIGFIGTPVPEPVSFALLASGLIVGAFARLALTKKASRRTQGPF